MCHYGPGVLRLEQIERRRKFVRQEPQAFSKIFTSDKIWIFRSDSKMKQQSTLEKRMKKAVLIMLFGIKDIILEESITEGTTVNKYYYKEVLAKL